MKPTGRIDLDALEWQEAIFALQRESDPRALAHLVSRARGIPPEARAFLAKLIAGKIRPAPRRRGIKPRLLPADLRRMRRLAKHVESMGYFATKAALWDWLAREYNVARATVREVLSAVPRRRYAAKARK